MTRRQLLLHIRRRAHGHPPGPEAQLRLLLVRAIRAERPHHARQFVEHHRQDAPRPRTVARRELRKQAKRIADHMAKTAHENVARAIGVKVKDVAVDLEEQAWNVADGVVRIFEDYSVEVSKRAHDLLADLSGEELEASSLREAIGEALDGAESGALNSLRLLFGDAWGTMNQSAQVQLGVEGYLWVSMRDKAVRPEHADLDDGETVYSWDDPPLKAEDSSNGEDCHPGSDFSCRCTAAPVTDEERAQIEADE